MLKCLVVMCLTNVGTEEQKAGKVSGTKKTVGGTFCN